MKKLLAMLFCAVFAIQPACALSESTSEPPISNPFEDRLEDVPPQPQTAADEAIALEIDGESILLAFDSSPEYSSMAGGLVQASFYAYGSDDDTMYELYIIFPETVQAGMIITPDYASLTNEESSVVVIISIQREVQYYFSSQMDGGVYPVD